MVNRPVPPDAGGDDPAVASSWRDGHARVATQKAVPHGWCGTPKGVPPPKVRVQQPCSAPDTSSEDAPAPGADWQQQQQQQRQRRGHRQQAAGDDDSRTRGEEEDTEQPSGADVPEGQRQPGGGPRPIRTGGNTRARAPSAGPVLGASVRTPGRAPYTDNAGGLTGSRLLGAHSPPPLRLPSPGGAEQAGSGGASAGLPPIPGRRCGGCGALSTPLWRHGPDGPKTLCNACGVRDNRKKGRVTQQMRRKSGSPASAGKAGTGVGTAAGTTAAKASPTPFRSAAAAAVGAAQSPMRAPLSVPASPPAAMVAFQSMGNAHGVSGLTGIKRRHHELAGLGVSVLTTASLLGCAATPSRMHAGGKGGPSAAAAAKARSRGGFFAGALPPASMGAAHGQGSAGYGRGALAAPGCHQVHPSTGATLETTIIPTPQCTLVAGYESLYPAGFTLPQQLIRAKSGPARLWGPGPTSAPLYSCTSDDLRWLAHANAGCNPGGCVSGSAAPPQLLTQRQLERCIDLFEIGSWEAGRVLNVAEVQHLVLLRHGDWVADEFTGGGDAAMAASAGGESHPTVASCSSRRVTGAPPPGGCGAPSPAAVSAAHTYWLRRRAAASPEDPSMGLLGSRFALPPPQLRRRPEDATSSEQVEHPFVFNAAAVTRQRAETVAAAARRGGGAASAAASRKRRRKDADVWAAAGGHKKRRRVHTAGAAGAAPQGEGTASGQIVRRRVSPLDIPLRFISPKDLLPPPPPPIQGHGNRAAHHSGNVLHLWSGPVPPRNVSVNSTMTTFTRRRSVGVPRRLPRVPVLGIFSAMGMKLGPNGKPRARWGATRAGGTTPQVCSPAIAAAVDAAEAAAVASAYADAMAEALRCAQALAKTAQPPTGGKKSDASWQGGGRGVLSRIAGLARRAVASHAA